jgi:NAD(P)-dependent dehydrogenase (short-subunit alcohol dehydrogenase family)
MTPLFNLTGKAALVTGGNGGIGLGIARGLAQAGARVALIARNTAKSHAAATDKGPVGARACSQSSLTRSAVFFSARRKASAVYWMM